MAKLIEQVVGHTAQLDQLVHMQQSGRWPHAVLLAGPSGVGKRKIALAFSQILICKEDSLACGQCGPCLRVEKEQSESLLFVMPDEKAAKPTIKVDAVRDLLSSLSLSSGGAARVVLIDYAHTMNPQAANALLKTLEEPFENVYFILISEDAQQMLPTIRSRVQTIRFSTLSFEEIKQVRPGQAEWAYRSSRGQVDRLDLLTSDEGVSKREESLSLFEQFCADEKFLVASDWRAAIKDRTWAQFNVSCWLQIIRDVVILKTQQDSASASGDGIVASGTKFILNTDQIGRLKNLFQIQTNKLLWLAEELVIAEREIAGNIDPVLIFEDMWVKYANAS